jgi:RNA polymerase sigma-70 factor (ECF subfamily)
MSALAEPETPDLLQTLVDNHRRFLAFLRKRVDSAEAAEDILQDGFVRALAGAGQVRDGGSIIAWFYRLLRNAVIDYHRRQGAESRALERAAALEAVSGEIEDQEMFTTVCGCILSLVETIKPAYADAIRQVELEDRTLADYAARAGISPGNAAVRVHRAREALRKQVIRSCGTCVTHGCEDCSCGRERPA